VPTKKKLLKKTIALLASKIFPWQKVFCAPIICEDIAENERYLILFQEMVFPTVFPEDDFDHSLVAYVVEKNLFFTKEDLHNPTFIPSKFEGIGGIIGKNVALINFIRATMERAYPEEDFNWDKTFVLIEHLLRKEISSLKISSEERKFLKKLGAIYNLERPENCRLFCEEIIRRRGGETIWYSNEKIPDFNTTSTIINNALLIDFLRRAFQSSDWEKIYWIIKSHPL